MWGRRSDALLLLVLLGAAGFIQSIPFTDTILPIIGEVVWLPEVPGGLHAAKSFVGSPSIVQTDSNIWLASHDKFFDVPVGAAYVYLSDDLVDWAPVAEVSPMYWAQLFNNGNQTYIIGTSDDMSGSADIVISRCLSVPCNGHTWTTPSVLFKGTSDAKYHTAPTPIVTANGTLYRAFDVTIANGDLGVLMLRAPVSCTDLTSPSCWNASPAIAPPSHLTSGSNGRFWEEPGAIVDANGRVSVMVRLDGGVSGCTTLETCNRAALLNYDGKNNKLSFDSLVQFPSSCNKFAVRLSPVDGMFYSLTNPVTHVPVESFGIGTCGQRNTVVLTTSKDLKTWKVCKTVLYDDTGLALNDSLKYTGLQYIDFRFHGSDMIAAVRSGYRGSTSYHDANRLLIVNVSDYSSACGNTNTYNEDTTP